MHPCLQIPELLQQILDSCEQRDVLYMGLACRTFTPAALDILWRDLHDGVAPLTYCFPAGIVQTQTRRNAIGDAQTTLVSLTGTFELHNNI